MDPLPTFVDSWVVKRTGERHYVCRLCAPYHEDHGIEEGLRRHLSSWSHKIRIMQREALFCKVCNLQSNYPSQYKKHLNSKNHKQKENPELKLDLKCDACSVSFSCKADQQRHLETKKHMKNLQPKDTAKYQCEPCNLRCKCLSQYEIHLATAKHAKNVAK